MTQLAFLRKADIPTNRQIEEIIQRLGYDFKILNEPDKKIGQGGLDCSINGYKTYFETYIDTANSVISENEAYWIIKDITHEDTAISFIWGADYAAGACISLILVALIDLNNALVYYLDDQMKYSREMLMEEMPQFLGELGK